MDVPVALVEPAEEHRAEVHSLDPVGDFLEPDVLLGQHVTDVDPGVLPANAAVAADQAALNIRGSAMDACKLARMAVVTP